MSTILVVGPDCHMEKDEPNFLCLYGGKIMRIEGETKTSIDHFQNGKNVHTKWEKVPTDHLKNQWIYLINVDYIYGHYCGIKVFKIN